MSDARATVRAPLFPRPEILSHADYTIFTESGAALLSYDPVTCAGLIYVVATRRWMIHTPILFDEFLALLQGAGFSVAESDDARRWRAACGGDMPAQARLLS